MRAPVWAVKSSFLLKCDSLGVRLVQMENLEGYAVLHFVFFVFLKMIMPQSFKNAPVIHFKSLRV